MRRTILGLSAAAFLFLSPASVLAQSVPELGADFWSWRAQTQPATGDDIPRIARPDGWTPDWSPAAVARRYQALGAYEARWRALAGTQDGLEAETDYRLVGSALARVRWEMDHVAAWRRQPHFYVEQALVPIFEALLPPPPVQSARLNQVIALLDRVPAILEAGQANLDDVRGPFAQAALSQLDIVPDSLRGMAEGLKPFADRRQQARLDASLGRALTALQAYRGFIDGRLPTASSETAIGRESYAFFLREVALYPYSPEELQIMGRQEWARTVLFEELERNRNRDLQTLPIRTPIDAVTSRLDAQELKVRDFLETEGLLTVTAGVGHYNAQPFPAYLKPIGWLGRTFDLTNPHRLDENATVYLPDPSPDLGYFNLSITRDPRPIIVHEGVPGHYFQLATSWRHPNPIRRHYYDSGANEGTGFYAEEMMLQAGLFDTPQTREIIYNFGRLRALRVEVDVKLALGEFTIDEAADYLESMVPMDRQTAEEEAVFFAAAPGQAISYQIGKLQTVEFLAEARVRKGAAFNLREFHDFLWLNGNVPVSLLRAEYFGRP
jgi:hypothetical protein